MHPATKARQEREKDYYQNPRRCAICDDPIFYRSVIHYDAKVCSNYSCRSKYKQKKRLCQNQNSLQESRSQAALTIPIPLLSPESESLKKPRLNETPKRQSSTNSKTSPQRKLSKTSESGSSPIPNGTNGSRPVSGSEPNPGYGPHRGILYKQKIAYVHHVWTRVKSYRKAARLLGLNHEVTRNNCHAHERLAAKGESFYADPAGWDLIRKRQDNALDGDLMALRAGVALLKLECHRAGIDVKKLANCGALD